MGLVDIKLNKVVLAEIVAKLKAQGVHTIADFITMLETIKPDIEPLIECTGLFGFILETADGVAADKGMDFVISLLKKVEAELQKA